MFICYSFNKCTIFIVIRSLVRLINGLLPGTPIAKREPARILYPQINFPQKVEVINKDSHFSDVYKPIANKY